MKRKICIVTATRAEYGLLRPLMYLLRDSEDIQLQIIVTGAHLSPEFGLTYKNIESDGFVIDEKIEMLLSSDTPSGIVKTMGLTLISFPEALSKLKPDMLVVLGDRYEMLSIASAAIIFKIPIAHLHGGEITEGAYDDAIRHAITKLSHLHFTSTEEYRKRVIQLGENPNLVFNTGAIGVDNIRNIQFLSKNDLEESLKINFKKFNYQVTFHPETLNDLSSKEQFQQLLDAIEEQKDSFFIFTKANADTDGRIINQMIDEFVAKHAEVSCAFTSLGTVRFLSFVKICDAIVGNSSSGIIEAPSLKTPTINIGDRQRGRTQALSVINCAVEKTAIRESFDKVKEENFKKELDEMINPYGEGGAAKKIADIISAIDLNQLKTKNFYNIEID